MVRIKLVTAAALVSASVVMMAGCAKEATTVATATTDAERMLREKERRLAALEAELATSKSQVATLEKKVESGTTVVAAAPTGLGGDLFPPNAKAGECYTRVLVPANYETKTERLLKRAASDRVEIIPAKYEWVEEQVLVTEASERIEVVPAEYGYAEEQVLVKPASTRLVEVPAEYGWEEEKILVKPAHQIWKKGRGPIERVNDGTGEILCLVEVPAEYRTVRKKVVKSPATTRTVEIPAEYKTVRKKVVKNPATTRTVTIPAEYKTVRVRKMVSPPRENRIPIPEEYQTVTRRVKVTEEHMAWREILCETNAHPGIISQIQRALTSAGYNTGGADGRIGPQTLSAVAAYQRAKGLPVGGLTMRTIESLGIKLR